VAGGTDTSTEAGSADLGTRLATEIEQLDRELAEIDLLIGQARAEAARHEAKRTSVADKLTGTAWGPGDGAAAIEVANQVITLTKRATIMEAQAEVLEGKRKVLSRFRDAAAGYLGSYDPSKAPAALESASPPVLHDTAAGDIAVTSRLLLTAQEDLRREIARAMHDGPAQSLTNIVLQAQIVERIVGGSSPEAARVEVRQLIEMVEQTLEATKSFIFDVRPLVLDDLGLMPTLRRAARDRGRRSGVAVEFESVGQDRRLAVDIESGLFRILDDALAGYLASNPERIELRVAWDDDIQAEVAAFKTTLLEDGSGQEAASGGMLRGLRRGRDPKDEKKRDLPPALAAMVEEQKVVERDAAEAARVAALVTLPPAVWREIQSRAASLDFSLRLLDEGSRLRVVVPQSASDAPSASSGNAAVPTPA
jgi:two-component system sensor histidine kinase DegS